MNGAGPVGALLAAIAAVLAVAAVSTRADPRTLGRLGRRSAWPGLGAALRRIALRLGRAVMRRTGIWRTPPPPDGWTREELLGVKVLAAAAPLVLLIALPAPVPLLAPPLAMLAFRVPDLLVARRLRRTAIETAREVPVFLDLLAVATSAGLPPQLAVRESSIAVRGPLGRALRDAARTVELGGRWRDELAAVARRLASPELDRIVRVLARSERLGSALTAEVTRLASDVRESRRARATERARTAPVKMLFPLVFLILPAFLLLTVVPVLVTTVRSMA